MDNFTEAFNFKNQAAFKALFDQHYIPLTRYALRFLADPAVAEEIVQDLFIYLWEHKDELEVNGSVKAYLYGAVKNRAINYLKSKIHHLHQNMQDIDAVHHLDHEADQTLRVRELNELLEKVFRTLPVQTASIFVMSRQGGMSHSEIAQELSISKKGVEYHVGSALKVIREVLKKYGYLIATVFFFLKSFVFF
jgi:RNA polymerase sigma-70 factor (ECF subfamily)